MNKEQDRHYANYKQAAGILLDDNLVWSADMDSIRVHLGKYIKRMAVIGDFADFDIQCLVQDLISSENDLSI